ncbi:MAG TPA: right-handed parallel beta-helix repeat-containing protein [Thermoplasmata archaeon]|nr:right-handed parallel beta-helix repeat-containing protein [Thermoplasmata archaeon]
MCPPHSPFHDNVIEGGTVGVNASASEETFYNCRLAGIDPPQYHDQTWLYAGHADLARNYIGNMTAEGVRVRSYMTVSYPSFPRAHVEATRNRIEDNVHGIHLEGNAVGHTTYTVYANLSDNNTVANNAQYGIYVDAATVDLVKLRVWWNDVRDNTAAGLYVTGDPPGPDYFHAECNWWNSAGGPYDPIPPPAGEPDWNDNPDPNAQPVSDYFWYRDLDNDPYWLQEPSLTATSCKL